MALLQQSFCSTKKLKCGGSQYAGSPHAANTGKISSSATTKNTQTYILKAPG